jgi:hypothetical protein
MKTVSRQIMLCAMVIVAVAVSGLAQAPPELKAKLDAQIKQLQAISADPQVVAAVKEHNAAAPSAEVTAMTNEKWAGLSLFDPFVKAVAKAPVSGFLKSKTDDVISEVFVSGADGRKVGFAAKTTYYSHKGMPKHEVPMTGKTFIGPPKQDESTGVMEIQVGLPVMDGGKAIGSIVFGLRVDKLR